MLLNYPLRLLLPMNLHILRGLKPRYEVHRGVGDYLGTGFPSAVVYSIVCSLISYRFLPDKAIDL